MQNHDPDKGGKAGMPLTPDDIRREHEQALASLTDEQCYSLWRQRHARQMTNFNGLTEEQNLQGLFEREARERSAEAEQPPVANDNRPRAPRRKRRACPEPAFSSGSGAAPQ